MVGKCSCAYSANDMVDVDNGIVVGVDATTAIRRTPETSASRRDDDSVR